MTEAVLGDCMEFIRQMSDNAFDLAVVDPPYGIGVCSRHRKKTGNNYRGGVHSGLPWMAAFRRSAAW